MAAAEQTDDLARLEAVGRVLVRERAGGGYVVLCPESGELLRAAETSGIVSAVLAGRSRAFEIDVRDTSDRVVMKVRRPYAVGGQKMEVCVRGEAAGLVRQEVTLLKPVLCINSAADRPLYRLKGPVSVSAHCDFDLYSMDKKRVGTIRRRWEGGGAERDAFIVIFPPSATLHHKASIIATAFLIDFLYYL